MASRIPIWEKQSPGWLFWGRLAGARRLCYNGFSPRREENLDTEPGRPEAPKPDKRKDMGGLAHGLQFGLMTIGGLAAGYWLDRHYLPSPLGTLGGLFLGSALGMYVLARSVR